MWPLISAGWWRSSAITATPSSSAGRGVGEHLQRLQPERAGVVVGPHRRVAELGAARRQRRRDLGVEPGGDSEAAAHRLLEHSDALDVRRLREHVDRLHAPQRIAGLDELSRVRRQRRRVAGDVDDPRRLALEQPADDLLREPGARRVDDDHVGRARLARAAARSRAGRRRATKRALSIPFAAALCSASATASGDALEAPDLARLRRRARGRSCRSRSRGRRRARCR